jgi:deoxycytidine triphosphate deaminase
MILVDKDLRERIHTEPSLIKGCLSDSQIGAVSCDLTVSEVVGQKWKDNRFALIPQAVVFVKTNEILQMPNDLVGIVTEKNSRMRQGLKVDAPRYQPGHCTAMFLRVQNISDQTIYLEKDMEIAQIMFELLRETPEKTYDKQDDASFNKEMKYRGFGNYDKEYNSQISDFDDKVKEAKEDIESASHRIYSNVLALMGIIVAVFSLITINYNTATQANVDFRFLIAMNLSLGFCIVLLMGLIFIFVNTRKHKFIWITYLVILILLAAAVVAYSFYAFHC